MPGNERGVNHCKVERCSDCETARGYEHRHWCRYYKTIRRRDIDNIKRKRRKKP